MSNENKFDLVSIDTTFRGFSLVITIYTLIHLLIVLPDFTLLTQFHLKMCGPINLYTYLP